MAGSAAKPTSNAGLNNALAVWAEKGLADYLKDADKASLVIDWLHRETGINRIALRLGIKVLTPLAVGATSRAAGWIGEFGRRKLERQLKELPFYETLVENLTTIAGRLDKEIAAKQEFKQIVEGQRPPATTEHAGALSLELRAQLAQITRLEAIEEEIRTGFDRIAEHLAPQPPLDLPLLRETEENRFYFGVQKVPFTGRKAELRRLDEFLYSDKSFTWWAITGDGGLGKSRLMLECCLSNAGAWRTGFLSSDADFSDWRNWCPDGPTLLVADYAAQRAEKLGEMIRTLARNASLDFPVRLLLLERSPDGPWFAELTGRGGDGPRTQHAQIDAIYRFGGGDNH